MKKKTIEESSEPKPISRAFQDGVEEWWRNATPEEKGKFYKWQEERDMKKSKK